jgi:CRISPR/Cas system-associated endoribonuclease Cas2
LLFDRVSVYNKPHDRNQQMTNKEAAKLYRNQASVLEAELEEARASSGAGNPPNDTDYMH